MSTARKITDVDVLPLDEKPASDAEKTVHEVMVEAAACTDNAHFVQLMRSAGPRLIEALTALADVDRPPPKQSLETRLQEIGVRQNILDNLAISRLHAARADRTWFALGRFGAEIPDEARDRCNKFRLARWEYAFGVTFLIKLASGAFTEDAPGVNFVLAWMRESACTASVHALRLEDELRQAA